MNYVTPSATDHPPNHVSPARIIFGAEPALLGHALPKRLGPYKDSTALVAGKPLDGGIGGLGIEQEIIAVEPANESPLRLPFFLLDLAGAISTTAPAPIACILRFLARLRIDNMGLSRGYGGAE